MLTKLILVVGINIFCLPLFATDGKMTVKSKSEAQGKMLTFTDQKIKNVRYVNSNLQGTIFRQTTVENFSFRNSNLSGVKIHDSTFNGGDFIGTTFSDAFIADSIFSNCILPADFLDQAILVNVKVINCRYQ